MASLTTHSPAGQAASGITRSGCSGITPVRPSGSGQTMISSPQAGQTIGVAFMLIMITEREP